METKTFVYYNSSSEEEIKLTKEILNGEKITKSNKKEISERILKLDLIDQLHILSCIHDLYYQLSDQNTDVMNFLSQRCFNTHRDILYASASDENIPRIEKKYNIKIERLD